jgi:outer membrane protein assembly factor BamB
MKNFEKKFILTAPKPNPLDKKYPLMTVNDNYPNIKIKWIYDDEHTITSAPVLIGNSVVVSSGKGITILDRESGKMKWQYKTEEAVYPAPAIYKNNAIFTSGDGYVYSVDFVNKKLVWKFFCESASVAAPNVESERVYVGSSSGNFYCLDAKDGNLIWKYSGVDGYVESRPSIYKDKIVFGAWDNYLYCLNKNSGELLWKWSNGRNNILLSPAVCTPVIKDDNVFIVAPDRYLSMININTGETLLRTNRYAVREAIGIAEDSLLIFSKSMYDTAFACRVKNDTLIYEWTAKLDYGYDFAPSYPMNKSGTLYFGTKNGFVYALDSKNGSMKWKYKLNDCLVNDICPISDKSLIVSSLNGKVYYLYDAGISKHDNFTFSHGGIVRLDTAKKNIYLAFTGHDFSDGKYIIQQVLKKNGARASFFFTGDFYRNEENKEIIMQLKKDGSYLGAHSDKHLLYCDWVNRDSSLVSKDSFMVDLANNYTELEKIGIGKNEALYYMPPYEWYNKEISEWCEEFGIQIINFTPGTYSNADYTVPSMGNRYLSSDTIYNRIIRYEQNSSNGLNGFILLLHIGTDEERTDKMYNRLDGLIFELKKKGYKFLSLKDIL